MIRNCYSFTFIAYRTFMHLIKTSISPLFHIKDSTESNHFILGDLLWGNFFKKIIISSFQRGIFMSFLCFNFFVHKSLSCRVMVLVSHCYFFSPVFLWSHSFRHTLIHIIHINLLLVLSCQLFSVVEFFKEMINGFFFFLPLKKILSINWLLYQ